MIISAAGRQVELVGFRLSAVPDGWESGVGAEGDESVDAEFVGGGSAERLESGRRGRPVETGSWIVDVGGLGQRTAGPVRVDFRTRYGRC